MLHRSPSSSWRLAGCCRVCATKNLEEREGRQNKERRKKTQIAVESSVLSCGIPTRRGVCTVGWLVKGRGLNIRQRGPSRRDQRGSRPVCFLPTLGVEVSRAKQDQVQERQTDKKSRSVVSGRRERERDGSSESRCGGASEEWVRAASVLARRTKTKIRVKVRQAEPSSSRGGWAPFGAQD